jgi:hypothetical protein
MLFGTTNATRTHDHVLELWEECGQVFQFFGQLRIAVDFAFRLGMIGFVGRGFDTASWGGRRQAVLHPGVWKVCLLHAMLL